MDWQRYKQLCDSPPVFTRWMLEQTIELVRGADGEYESLEAVLQGQALLKPDDHKGGAATDMFELQLSEQQASGILAIVTGASARGEMTPATRQRGLGGFVEAWREYENYLKLE